MLAANIKGQENRRDNRLGTYLPVSFRLNDSSQTQRSLISDLSNKGLRLIVNDLIPKASSLLLELELKELPQILNLSGNVVWTKSLGYGGRHHIGIEFQDINTETKSKLDEYLQLRFALT